MIQYLGLTLNASENGALMDLRLKLAIELLKSPLAAAMASLAPQTQATWGLSLAESLVNEAEARGYIQPLPEGADLTDRDYRHIERAAMQNVHGQSVATQLSQRAGMIQAGYAEADGGPISIDVQPLPPLEQ